MILYRKLPQFARYSMLSGGGFAIALAVDRLVVCPVLNRQLGSEVFGGFMWTMGLMNLFGNISANGFALLLLRDLTAHDDRQSGTYVRTALTLSAALSVFILAGTAWGGWLAADSLVRQHASGLFVPLGTYAFVRSFEWILFAVLRVERRFADIFVLRVAGAAVLLFVLVIASSANLWLVGGIYCLAALITTGGSAWVVRPVLRNRTWWNGATAKSLLLGWTAGAALTLSEQMQVYGSRLLLGVFSDTYNVTVLYAGTSIGNLFVAPVGLLGGVVLSMLAKHRRFVFAGGLGVQYLALTSIMAVVVGLGSYVLGPIVVCFLYDNVAIETNAFYHWIALANGLMAAALVLRPVAIKYLPLRRGLFVSIVIAVVQLVALGLLIPRLGAAGAAIALAVSSFVAALLWVICFFQARAVDLDEADTGDATGEQQGSA